MIFHDVEQNTDEWLDLRAGKLTSSNLAKVMANYGKAFGEPAKKLAVEIALEQITGERYDNGYTNDHMERGHEQEPIARDLYEQENFITVSNGGFFDNGFTGMSPDGLVGDDGVIEIKSAIPSIHFARIKKQSIDSAYKWQCVSNIKGSGRQWLDFISYCAAFPEERKLYIYRLHRKNCTEEFDQIDARVAEFKQLVDESIELITTSQYRIY